MILWIDDKTPCRIPSFAHHYIGVGGIVLKGDCMDNLQVLLIKEHRSDQPLNWKLPGGFMDPDEKIMDAV